MRGKALKALPKRPEDTIAAVSTPPGEGGIGIVRLSGANAAAIVRGVFFSSRNRPLDQGRVFHGEIRDDDGTPLDEVLVHIMRAPHSYTREDVVEINCHGGAGPVQAVLDLVLRHGARLATPGEFTKRAFLNGRIDLVQAEAVIDRIRAQTRAGLRAASASAGGALSRSLYELRDALADALAHVEAAVDFPDEDLPDLVNKSLREGLERTLARMNELLATAEAGRLYREGARMGIAGRPNVGKSSLFNALLRDSRAIVTPVAGTTRDLIEEIITISGIPVRLTDTAGLRASEDEVEQIGIEVARKALGQSDAVLFVMDASVNATSEDEELARELFALEVPVVLVLNKCDLAPEAVAPAWTNTAARTCSVSAKTGQGLPELEGALSELLLGAAPISPDQGLITRAHQRDSLRRAAAAVTRLLDNFDVSPEFLSIDLREALQAVGEITGETTPDAILETIFASFCIGK
ncbi:MAG: tRNA uridine-5-carboxymethylaminomethyl(34) synthesis GTPase MnmE [Candidatus Hydrogenedentes bacterium]|nr:tRNA uridine-5-carboxymethylaminomethyl(34) synthesis GTPase MnmE [Candidatus Hydrogenedentota bacterium]